MFPKLLPGEAVMILPLYELKRRILFWDRSVFCFVFFSSLSHGLISVFCEGLVSRPKLTSLSCSPYCLLLAAGQYTARAWEETIQGLNGSFLSGCRTVCVGTSLISESDTETDRWAIRFIYFFFQVVFSWVLLPTFTLRLPRKRNYCHFPVMDYFQRFTAWYIVNKSFTCPYIDNIHRNAHLVFGCFWIWSCIIFYLSSFRLKKKSNVNQKLI